MVAAAAALLGLSSSAHAQPVPAPATQPAPSDAPPGTSRVDEARRLIAEGVRCFRAHDYAGAVRAFSAANAAVPSPDLWYNIARAREMAQEYAEAVADYQRYLRDKIDAPDRAEVERRIADLGRLAEIQREARLRRDQRATLRFFVEGHGAEGASFALDGAELARDAALSPREVSVGEHRVRVWAPGAMDWVSRVRVREGEAMGVYARLWPATRYVTRPAPHIASAILGGLSLVAVGVAAYYGVQAAGEDCDRCGAQLDQAHRSDVALGVGGGLALGAVVAYFIERGASRTERVGPPATEAMAQRSEAQ